MPFVLWHRTGASWEIKLGGHTSNKHKDKETHNSGHREAICRAEKRREYRRIQSHWPILAFDFWPSNMEPVSVWLKLKVCQSVSNPREPCKKLTPVTTFNKDPQLYTPTQQIHLAENIHYDFTGVHWSGQVHRNVSDRQCRMEISLILRYESVNRDVNTMNNSKVFLKKAILGYEI